MTPKQASHITQSVIDEAMSYEEYRNLIDDRLEEDKTTGLKQSEALTKYTRLNVHRMNRLDKRTELIDSLKEKLQAAEQPLIWLVLTEGWCGDAAQNVPVMAKMADVAPNIQLKLILRTKNLDIMDEHLTNGGRSIPKLICLDAESLEELGSWGPRPEPAQELFIEMREEGATHEEIVEKIQKWYADDKTQQIQAEFEALLDQWS